ncbi:MAG: DUF58 domain-containing protein [Planctomycetota bacterium]
MTLSPLSFVVLKLAVAGLPLAALAWRLRIYPDRRLVFLALVPALLSFGLLGTPGFFWPLVGLDAVLVLVAAADLASLPRRSVFSVERRAVRVASLRKRHPVSLTVSNHSRRNYPVTVRDGVPHLLNPRPAEFTAGIEARSRMTWDYVLRPGRRGAFTLSLVHLKARSRLRFWQRLVDYTCETVLDVYPDMQQLAQYAVLARTNRLSQLGVRRTRRVGRDHDFERLRDYTVDDNYKHIDWRATARRRKLTVKDYQTSQSQRILFLLDCGRMMTNEAAGLSLLDHALNAVLMLSYVALRQSDSVGLICFSDEIHAYVPPRGGMNQMNRLLRAGFDRFPRLVESRYDQAFRYLASRTRKRSLVVLVTNVIDEVNANQVQQYLTNLVGRHLPLGVLLRDRRLFDAVEVEHPQEDAFWRAAAAAEILAWRHQVLTDLKRKGALTLDVFPEQMTSPLVNRYLEIKARHLL